MQAREPLPEVASSARRARELYKYFVPPGSAFATTQSNLPDNVLTAHAQLVAWRLNAGRAMVSLIDRDIQYFVAEATKTLHLDDQYGDSWLSSQYDEPSDAIWAGCVAVPKAGRLCEHTIQQLPRQDGTPAYFEVLDLTEDDRFFTLPFVTGEPHFRYYCGVPLRTKNGIPIGSLFALDDKIREPIGRADQMFLATMAENVMSHYENIKEKDDRKRVLNMNMCLAAFVDPENQVKRRKRRRPSHNSSVPSKMLSEVGDARTSSPKPSRRSSRPVEGTDDESEDGATGSNGKRVEEDDGIDTFKRAADLLHASLSLEGGGGCVFLDTATSYRSRHQRRKSSDRSSDGGDSDVDKKPRRRPSLGTTTLHSQGSYTSWGPPQLADPPELTPVPSRPADILASTWTPGPQDGNQRPVAKFSSLTHDDLARLIKRNPRGKFFNLDADSTQGSSSSGEEAIYNIPRTEKLTPSKFEALLLLKHFPGARQLIFLPLWDSTASRFSVLIAYSTSDFRTFSSNPDFLYCIAFCNCVMTEITRLATMAADQQKSDFIGSISHELRSPLHGILASCEFLADTETTTFQRSLVDTADSCARTLLDTINMVLDYSKINAFERNAKKVRRKHGELDTTFAQGAGQPQMNIFGDVDLAAITEEVVEGVATGQVFKDSLTGVDAVDLSSDGSRTAANAFSGRKDVEIILDIAPRASAKDWIFVTQPGAFRRIIMNICGNALKYTRTGYIRVKLEAHNTRRPARENEPDEPPTTVVRITITDTGQGMSPQFMRTKLYTPFAQENSIAPGTGLGLSLVKSMVTMLNGEINIQSSLGVGTEVTVTFPMTLSSSNNTSDSNSGSTPSSAGSIERVKDDSLLIVQRKARNRRAILFPDHPHEPVSEATRMNRDVINRYLTGWYGFQVVAPFSVSDVPDIIIADEADLPALIKLLPGGLNGTDGPMVVVLCTATNRKAADKTISSKSTRIEAVSHPFGPYKLAKGIKWCLEKLEHSLVKEMDAETEAQAAAEVDPVVDEAIVAVEQMTISTDDPDVPDVNIIKSGGVLAHEDSVHAQLVVSSSTDTDSSGGPERLEYPFPGKNDGTVSPSNLELANERPALNTRKTISPTRMELKAQHAEVATPMSHKGVLTTAGPSTENPKISTKAPRLLLVDDNKVNLRLLQTFMNKRKYTDVHSAEDGSQAVSIYRQLLAESRPPEVIFMDISMPIMNGFQATREIREIEAEYREHFPSPMQTPASSLIIALTGLASGRDQSEAFTSGFDLFLTKPTSFREVGRLLDNWEKNGGAATVGVPHGAVTGEGMNVINE